MLEHYQKFNRQKSKPLSFVENNAQYKSSKKVCALRGETNKKKCQVLLYKNDVITTHTVITDKPAKLLKTKKRNVQTFRI